MTNWEETVNSSSGGSIRMKDGKGGDGLKKNEMVKGMGFYQQLILVQRLGLKRTWNNRLG